MDSLKEVSALHPVLAPVACGLLSHALSHRYPPNSLPAFAAVTLLAPIVLTALGPSSEWGWTLLANIAIYLSSLATSITAYRLSPLHPLAEYPGPVLARISRLWGSYQVSRGQQYILSHEMFERYGNVVRTGPNHLLIREANAISVIHGGKERWQRHPRYQVYVPYDTEGSLLDLIDNDAHSKRRRIWERALTPNAIKSYEPILQERLGQFINGMTIRRGQPVDIAEWFGFFTLDFIGDLAFGGAFNFMNQGADSLGIHNAIVQINITIETLGAIPWIRPLLQTLPFSQPKRWLKIALDVAEKRKAGGSQIRDLFYYLLNEEGNDAHSSIMSAADMSIEASLALVAGSDTTATTLSNAIFYLIRHPQVFSRLRAEIDAACSGHGSYEEGLEPSILSELQYLQAVLNETLRLQPAVPNGIQRTSPGHDVVIPGTEHVIPAGTNAQIPTWSIHRDGRYFSPDPEMFWPERWLAEGPKVAEARGEEFTLFQGAFMPFHYGPANCVGRSLALHEARTLLAALVRRFNFAFAPGFEAQDWIDHLDDKFILVRAQLKIVLKMRE